MYNEVSIVVDDAATSLSQSSSGSYASTAQGECCNGEGNTTGTVKQPKTDTGTLTRCKKSSSELSGGNSYAANKNVAEGLMDIALLSANANQLRFLITYNHESTTYYYSLSMVILSLVLQLAVGLALIFRRRLKRCHIRSYTRTNELLVTGVFIITVINILLAAFTTTDEHT